MMKIELPQTFVILSNLEENAKSKEGMDADTSTPTRSENRTAQGV